MDELNKCKKIHRFKNNQFTVNFETKHEIFTWNTCSSFEEIFYSVQYTTKFISLKNEYHEKIIIHFKNKKLHHHKLFFCMIFSLNRLNTYDLYCLLRPAWKNLTTVKSTCLSILAIFIKPVWRRSISALPWKFSHHENQVKLISVKCRSLCTQFCRLLSRK